MIFPIRVLWMIMLAAAAAPRCEDPPFCKCGLQTVQGELARSDAVFTGVVLHVGEIGGDVVPRGARTQIDSVGSPIVTATFGWEGEPILPVTLRVDHAWKGTAAGDRIVVSDAPMCAVGFRAGGEYVVYAIRGADGILRTSYCMRTRSLPHAADDVRVLDSIAHR
jgi:hypothetical protein